MTTPHSTPSWLVLERYALGELSAKQRADVEQALTHDVDAQRCLSLIREQTRQLPPLPMPERAPATTHEDAGTSWWDLRWFIGGLAATIAVTALVVLRSGSQPTLAGSATSRGVKGGELSMSLVRERAGVIAVEPTVFVVGDRFMVRVTCADTEPLRARVSVIQGNETSTPMPEQTVTCGNLVVLGGAFRLNDALPTTVCVEVAPHFSPQPRPLPGAEGVRRVCTDLLPSR